MTLLVMVIVDMIVTPVLLEDKPLATIITVTLMPALLEEGIVTLMPALLEEGLVTLMPALPEEDHNNSTPLMVVGIGEDKGGVNTSYTSEQVFQVTVEQSKEQVATIPVGRDRAVTR